MGTRFVVGILLILGMVGYLAYVGFEEGKAYYHTCDEVAAMEDRVLGTDIRLAGNVVEGSIQKDGEIVTSFVLEYEGARYTVNYVGTDPVPDTFKDGVEAVVDGQLHETGVFEGQKIQAKCASKYEADYGPEDAAAPTEQTA